MANLIKNAKDLIKFDSTTKVALDLQINPSDTVEAVISKAKAEFDILKNAGVSPENIAFVGAQSTLSEINSALDSFASSIGGSFGGAIDAVSDIQKYLDDLDSIIGNKLDLSKSLEAKIPDLIPVDESLIKKYARDIDIPDAVGQPQYNFPDTFLPEERPVDGKTPLSDWKDKTRVIAETAGGASIEEKPSEFKAEYGKNVVIKSNTGHFIEMDDTEGYERINIQHKNGAFITIHQDKSIVIRGQNGIQLITYADGELFVGGNINITVMGDANISTNGDTNIDTSGDVNWKVGGDFNLDVAGDTFMANRGDIKMTAKQIRQNAGDPRVLDDVKDKTYKLGS